MPATRLRILFIPADSIEPQISRCAYIARGLSQLADVYQIEWRDPRSLIWQGKPSSLVQLCRCILENLFQRIRIYRAADSSEVYSVRCSLILDTLIYRILGRVLTTRIKCLYNGRVLRRVIRHIQPDVIFHADNFLLCSALSGNHISVSDTQDGINWESLGHGYRAHRREFLHANLQKMERAYIVSEAAKRHLNETLPSEIAFTVIPNGAAFGEIRSVSHDAVRALRALHQLGDKLIVSYIGSAAKFDAEFAKRLFSYAAKALPDTQFVIVGNIPSISFPNVTWVGAVPPETAAIYYNLSNVGTILRNCDDDPFLGHSVPLKVLQYAAARKPVVGFQVDWTREERFPNLFEVRSSDPVEWCNVLRQVCRGFRWTTTMDKIWAPYSWDVICKTIAEDLNSLLRGKLSNNRPHPGLTQRSSMPKTMVS